MIRSSACRQWRADHPGPMPESTATNAVTYTTPGGTICRGTPQAPLQRIRTRRWGSTFRAYSGIATRYAPSLVVEAAHKSKKWGIAMVRMLKAALRTIDTRTASPPEKKAGPELLIQEHKCQPPESNKSDMRASLKLIKAI
jgi:hypothetical protein